MCLILSLGRSSGVESVSSFLQVERSLGNSVITLQKKHQILTDSCKKCLQADKVL